MSTPPPQNEDQQKKAVEDDQGTIGYQGQSNSPTNPGQHPETVQVSYPPRAAAAPSPSIAQSGGTKQVPAEMAAALKGSVPPIIPPAIAAFASLPPTSPDETTPISISESDLVVYEYIAKRARATADSIDSSLAAIRAAHNSSSKKPTHTEEQKESTTETGKKGGSSKDSTEAGVSSKQPSRNIEDAQGERQQTEIREIATAMAMKLPNDNDNEFPVDDTDAAGADPNVVLASDHHTFEAKAALDAAVAAAQAAASLSQAAAAAVSSNSRPEVAHAMIPAPPPPADNGDLVLRASVSDANLLFKDTKEAEKFSELRSLTWTTVLNFSSFVSSNQIGVAPDAVVVALAQFQPCALTRDDRIGRYKHQEIGYVGLCCKHCFGQPGYGRYFPSTLPSFISSFPGTVTKHVGDDCLGCPQITKELVKELERRSQRSEARQEVHYGSKGLMESIWKILRKTSAEEASSGDSEMKARVLQVPVAAKGEGITWGGLLGGSDIVLIEDHCLVPDTLFASFAQMERCEANEADCRSIGRNRPSVKPGFVGIRCKYCKGYGLPIPPGSRLFPSAAGSLAQIDSCNKLVKHMARECEKIDDEVRRAILELQIREKSEPRRYGSRKIFFGRVWSRLHGDHSPPANTETKAKRMVEELEDDGNIPLTIEELVQGSELVSIEDRGMVSEAHFVAFAQLKPCRLTEADKCGWYKDREIGFPGVCCRHCDGRPSSGRYFPRTGDFFLRSSKHSIIRHVTESCQSCPKDVCISLAKLQRRDTSRSGWKIVDASVLGSGKLFHERIWRRLYTALNVTDYPMPEPETKPVPAPDERERLSLPPAKRPASTLENIKNTRRKVVADAAQGTPQAPLPESESHAPAADEEPQQTAL